ncbi:hypothetical protein P7K49_004382, partial [Saguinus oedipus]
GEPRGSPGRPPQGVTQGHRGYTGRITGVWVTPEGDVQSWAWPLTSVPSKDQDVLGLGSASFLRSLNVRNSDISEGKPQTPFGPELGIGRQGFPGPDGASFPTRVRCEPR